MLFRARPSVVIGVAVVTSSVVGGCGSSAAPAPPSTAVRPPARTGRGALQRPLPVVTIGDWTGRRPTTIYFSADAGNVATGLSWPVWTTSRAVGRGKRDEISCVPDCAAGTAAAYPVTVTMTDPVAGRFTTVVEQTADGRGTTESFQEPFLGESACRHC